MSPGLSDNDMSFLTKNSNDVTDITTKFVLGKIAAKNREVDDRVAREKNIEQGLLGAESFIKNTIYKIQTINKSNPNFFELFRTNQPRRMDLVTGVPQMCKIDFGNWDKAMLLKI